MSNSSLQSKMVRGAIWMALLNAIERSLGIVNMALLARMLSPADFGICAMAGSFILMAQMFTMFGFETALIQRQDTQVTDYHTAWTLNLVIGAAILLLMLFCAAPIAAFYRQPDLYWVVLALAFAPLISSCENIGVVAFRKELDFRKEFHFQLSRKLISFVITVSLAFWLRSYWALVAGMLAARLSGTLISYAVHPFRPRFSLAGTDRLLGVSKWLLVHNILTYLKENSPDFIIGRVSGATSLGMYSLSNELAHLPQNQLAGPVNRALLPGFAKLSDRSETESAYVNSVKLLGLITIPAAFGIFAVAPNLIPVILGSKWHDAVALVEILAISGAIHVFQGGISSLLIAKGFVAPVTGANSIFVALLIAGMVVAVPIHGALGAAYVTLAVTTLSTPVFLYHLQRSLNIPVQFFVAAFARPIVGSVLMILVVRLAMPEYQPANTFLQASVWLVAGVVAGVLTYIASVVCMWLAAGRPAGAEMLILTTVRKKYRHISMRVKQDR